MEQYLKDAIAEYERNIERGEPFYMDAAVLMDIEEYYEKNERAYDAERIMRFAEKLHPDSEDVLVVKAYRLKTAGKWHEAWATIRRIANQENRDVQLFLVEWNIASGQIDRACQLISKNMETGSQEEEEWRCDFADILLDYGYVEKALEYLQPLLHGVRHHRRVDELAGDAYYQLGRYDQSREAFNRLVDADVYDSFSWSQLAEVQSKAKRYEECISSCDYALAIEGTNVRAVELKLYSTFMLERYEEAEALFRKSEAKFPNVYTIRIYMGEFLNRFGRYEEAQVVFEDAMRLCPLDSPDRQRVVTGLVRSLLALRLPDRARQVMLTLTLCGVSFVEASVQLAGMMYEAGWTAEAVGTLAKAAHAATCGEQDYAGIMQILANNHSYQEAEALWTYFASLHFSPEYYVLYAYCAFAFFVLKKRRPFLESLHKAAEYCPDTLRGMFKNLCETSDLTVILQKMAEQAAGWQSEEDRP